VEPADAAQHDRAGEVLGAFGTLNPDGAKVVAVRLRQGEAVNLPAIVRALDSEGIAIEHIQMHAPSLDDVFLAKTGRSLEGAGDEDGADQGTGEHPAETTAQADR
jgi:ABC-2 type transport system ATP-binding protein